MKSENAKRFEWLPAVLAAVALVVFAAAFAYEFIADVSHEIKTPLTGILGAAASGFRPSTPSRLISGARF